MHWQRALAARQEHVQAAASSRYASVVKDWGEDTTVASLESAGSSYGKTAAHFFCAAKKVAGTSSVRVTVSPTRVRPLRSAHGRARRCSESACMCVDVLTVQSYAKVMERL